MDSLQPPPVPSSWKRGTSATGTPCPHTHAIGLRVEPVYQSGDTQASPLSPLLRGGEGGRLCSPSNHTLGWLRVFADGVA